MSDRDSGPQDFDDFFRAVYPRLVRSMVFVVGDRDMAGEFAQEAMARTLTAWDRMDSREHAERFAVRIAVNLARSRWRKDRRLDFGSDVPEAASTVGLPPEDAELLWRAVHGLSGRQRTCVALVDYLGFDANEAASMLGMRPSTVRVHLTRGRRHLAAQLRSEFMEETRDE